MQISRHWRLNAQRYRLQGVRYKNGEVDLQNRPTTKLNSGIDAVEEISVESSDRQQPVAAKIAS